MTRGKPKTAAQRRATHKKRYGAKSTPPKVRRGKKRR